MRILSFDIESCTGNPYDASLCSFGYVVAEDDKITEQNDVLCNPVPARFTLGNFGKTPEIKFAYTVKQFRSQPRFDRRYRAIKGLFESADVVIGFALQNDLKFINNACDYFSLQRIPFKFLDVQLLVGHIIPELKNHGLKAVAERFDIEFIEHRSDEDARVTFEVFKNLLSLTQKSVDELVQEFGVVYGENSQKGHTNCYSLTQVKERLEGKSRSTQKMIVNYYGNHSPERVKRQGNAFVGKNYAVAESVYLNDLDAARKICASISAQGGEYDSSIITCNYYVYGEGDKTCSRIKRLNPSCKTVSISEIEKLCNGLTDCNFDNFNIIKEHYAELHTDIKE